MAEAQPSEHPPAERPRFGIPTRIFAGFALVVVSFGTLLALSVAQHHRSAATLRVLHEGFLPLASNLTELQALEANAHDSLQHFDEDPDWTVSYVGGIRAGREQNVGEALADLERTERLDPGALERATLASVRTMLTANRGEYEGFEEDRLALRDALAARAGAAARGDTETEERAVERVEALLAALQARQGRISRGLRGALRDIEQRIADTSREAADAEARSVTTFAAFGLAALLTGVLLTGWARRLLAPLAALERRVLAVARGELSEQPIAGREDEIGRLGREFERMVAALAARDRRLRELQRTQDEIVASLRSGVIVVDGDGRVRATNRAASRILGAHAPEVGGTLARTFEVLPALEEALAAVGDGTAAVVREALPLGFGRGRMVDLRVSPFGEGRGARLAVIDDVSEALATKARLIQSERLAAMGRMAAHVTHEVRNPLSSIGLNVDMLRDEIRGTEATALLGSIQREIDRLTQFTEEYLRLARLPAPALALEPIEGVVHRVARFVEREMSAAEVKLEVHVEPELGVVLHDEAQIRQALLNLLRNAREAMPGGGMIELGARREGDGVALTVADRGEGIAPEVRARLFDVLFSTKERGTGLGLALTREIVVAHHGEVRCEPREGGGTLFTLWLPRAAPAGEVEERAAE